MNRKKVLATSLSLLVVIVVVFSVCNKCFSSSLTADKDGRSIAPQQSEAPKVDPRIEQTSNQKLAASITADAAILVNQANGKALFEKNADRREYPASMTKMMTCILAIESGKLNSTITISANAAAASDTYLSKGDRVTISNLLYMLMLSSNNGAAVAISENLSTRGESFKTKMNKKAKAIGMTATHFVTPNGMHDSSHYSTARDMAKLAAYCMRNATFRGYVKTETMRMKWVTPHGKHIMCRNENKLLRLYDGVNGIKTGYTDPALGCLASSYSKNGVSYIVVVMHSHRGQFRFHDTTKILDWAKKNC